MSWIVSFEEPVFSTWNALNCNRMVKRNRLDLFLFFYFPDSTIYCSLHLSEMSLEIISVFARLLWIIEELIWLLWIIEELILLLLGKKWKFMLFMLKKQGQLYQAATLDYIRTFFFFLLLGGLGVDRNLCCLSSHSRDKLMNRLCGFLVRITDNITCKETN